MRKCRVSAAGGLHVLCLGLALTALLAGQARAQPCQGAAAESAAKGCGPIHRFDADALIAAQAGVTSSGAILDGLPWITQSGVAPPIAVEPADGGVKLKTSLGLLRDFNSQLLAQRVQDAKAMTPATFALPKPPVVPSSPFDVWSRFDVDGLAHDADGLTRSGVGVDYKLSRSTSLGFSAQRADSRQAGKVGGAREDTRAAHLTIAASPTLSIEAQSQWQESNSPNASGKVDSNTVSVAPRFKYPVVLGDGRTVEPFVMVKDELTRGGVGPDGGETGRKNAISAGTGVTIARADAYSMSVTADVEGIGAVDPATLKSRFQLNIPLR